MQLRVTTVALEDAATALLRTADGLRFARDDFRLAAVTNLPAVGHRGEPAARAAVQAADAAAGAVIDDLLAVSRALRLLAGGYATMDQRLLAAVRR
jgi:hypothetical protein